MSPLLSHSQILYLSFTKVQSIITEPILSHFPQFLDSGELSADAVSTCTFPSALPMMIGEGESTAPSCIVQLASVRVLSISVQQIFFFFLGFGTRHCVSMCTIPCALLNSDPSAIQSPISQCRRYAAEIPCFFCIAHFYPPAD